MSKKKQYNIKVVDKTVCKTSSKLYYLPAPKSPPPLLRVLPMNEFVKWLTVENK